MKTQPELVPSGSKLVACLRCGRPCLTGKPDYSKREILEAPVAGYCADCMVTRLLMSIEPVMMTVNSSPQRGDPDEVFVPQRPGHGPQMFLMPHVQKLFGPLLEKTQLPADKINWKWVVENWEMPWPKGKAPKFTR